MCWLEIAGEKTLQCNLSASPALIDFAGHLQRPRRKINDQGWQKVGKRRSAGKNAANTNMCHGDGRDFSPAFVSPAFLRRCICEINSPGGNRGWGALHSAGPE